MNVKCFYLVNCDEPSYKNRGNSGYKSGITVDEVSQELEGAGFDLEFVNRATKEWAWKSGL